MAKFLGRPKAETDGKVVIKVGYSMDPNVRCYAFNHSMPKCAFEWEVFKTDKGAPPYPNSNVAEAGENEMKRCLIERGGESLGGEFFLTTVSDALHTWQAGKRAAEEVLDRQTKKKARMS